MMKIDCELQPNLDDQSTANLTTNQVASGHYPDPTSSIIEVSVPTSQHYTLCTPTL